MKRTLLFIVLLAFFKISLAQNIKVSGTVTDSETREGIPGANIIINGKLTGSFAELRPGRIDAYSIVDAQVSYKVPSIKSVVKLGGNNIFNNQIYQAYGSPSIGALYYVSVVFDQFLR